MEVGLGISPGSLDGRGRPYSRLDGRIRRSRSAAVLYGALAVQTGVQVLGSHWAKLSGMVARNHRESFGGVMTLEKTER